MSGARARSMRLRSSLLVAMPLLAACAPPPGFDHLRPFTLMLYVDMRDNVMAILEYNHVRLGCQTMASDFTGDMNGMAPVEVDPGRSVPSLGDPNACIVPAVEVPRPAGAAEHATITMTSGSDRLVAEVDGMGSNLGGQLAPGAVAHPGDTVQLALAPGSGGLQWPSTAEERVDGVDQVETIPLVAPSADGVLQVRLSGALPPGPAHVHAVAARTPVIAGCEGTTLCEWLDIATNVVMVNVDVAFDVSQ
jgi:hypothetical protein